MFGLGREGRAVVTSEVIILRVLIWVLVVWVPTWGQCIQPGALRICALTFKVNSGKEREGRFQRLYSGKSEVSSGRVFGLFLIFYRGLCGIEAMARIGKRES